MREKWRSVQNPGPRKPAVARTDLRISHSFAKARDASAEFALHCIVGCRKIGRSAKNLLRQLRAQIRVNLRQKLLIPTSQASLQQPTQIRHSKSSSLADANRASAKRVFVLIGKRTKLANLARFLRVAPRFVLF